MVSHKYPLTVIYPTTSSIVYPFPLIHVLFAGSVLSKPVQTCCNGCLTFGWGPSSDWSVMTGVAVTQRLTCSQQHGHCEVEHREPLEAITLPLYTAEVITGQERESRRISRSGDFSFAKKVKPDKRKAVGEEPCSGKNLCSDLKLCVAQTCTFPFRGRFSRDNSPAALKASNLCSPSSGCKHCWR